MRKNPKKSPMDLPLLLLYCSFSSSSFFLDTNSFISLPLANVFDELSPHRMIVLWGEPSHGCLGLHSLSPVVWEAGADLAQSPASSREVGGGVGMDFSDDMLVSEF